MRRFSLTMAIALGCVSVWGADWLTDGGNSQRTAWQKDERILSTSNVKDIKLLWKIKLDNEPRQMHNLFPPLIVERVNTSRGPKQIVIETGVSDNIYAIDVETGELIWKKHFVSTWTPPATGGRGGGILCPGGITATPVIAPASTPGKYTIHVASWDGMLHQLNAGRVHLLDSNALDRPGAASDAVNLNSSALASWQDSAGARWILGASSNAVVALKVLDRNGAPALQPGWTSRDIASPVAPMVVNGVVFTASTGPSPTILYALDATSGKELWNSGQAIAGAIRGGGLSAGNSQVYLATDDGTFYAFGFPIEH